MIGDHLARLAYPYLQQLDEDHRRGFRNYLQENYDHYVFFPSFTETNVLKMIRNCLVEGLNRRINLPDTIIVLCGEKFITEDPLYLPLEFERKIKWILREFETLIRIRKSLLPEKAYTLGQPRIMWVCAFQNTRANGIAGENLNRFNNLLKRLCSTKAVYTIPVQDNNSIRCFDTNGKTQIAEGFKFLWQEIINGVKHHDERDRQHEINQLVDDRLKEINFQNRNRQDRESYTVSSLERNLSFKLPRQRCDSSPNNSSRHSRQDDH